ncbi:hypothetical protein [Rhizobacter sp. SG703]|uniref:hypothetical protein n=1 Tax=Rhizobacter sp. SG703 TaxID=2587140 RepID=UPI0014452830|nr:hypothetical protein [Rhizobacter sp. SG703]NKI93496.1 hypothetical protein [Rhizobacter sp. SG703]
MASLYYTQYRSKSSVTPAGLHVYRSRYDSAIKKVVKARLGVMPMTGAGLPPDLVGRLPPDELREVLAKAEAVASATVLDLRARADLLERGLRT